MDGLEGANSLVMADPMAAFAAAEAKLNKALQLSSVPDHARAHMNRDLSTYGLSARQRGISKCEHALALDRNLAAAHFRHRTW